MNNRRLAERLALRLNELAEEEVARAHHGSLAREQRVQIEEDLKAGRIPCLVATSSLELGIDMGAVDLVIQVESPKSVARGLQRIGRAGHSLDEVSKGRIFPKFRADLLESAVVLQRMREGAIEETQIPRNPLDVLAQQIVAICAHEEIEVAELHTLVRGAYPFADLSRAQLENVLDMLAGRYPSDEFAELRPRIVWDRTAGVVRGRAGARRLAVTNAGTIPDRGLFGVFIVDGGGRVGELDEEMVYEARAGQVIMLGASSWRIEDITRDRVLVSPAPGVPGAVPFWKGEGVGRPYELGAAIGKFIARGRGAAGGGAARAPRRARAVRVRGAEPARRTSRSSSARPGVVPSDRTVVVERFRDEIGDWRICILTPFGARVHAPWAMAVGARLRESLGIEVQSIWSDDGIAFHLPDADAPPATDLLLLTSEELDELVLAEVGETALFGARFRENAARALLIPRRRPGERTPLWQQRLKAQGLLQVARKYASFPIVLETYRECLQDVFDLPALKQLLHGLRTRELDLVEVETASASPFASSLLFDYIATYMYEDDTPPAERRAQALSLDRDLLRELLGQEELRELIDADALAEVEASLRPRSKNPDHLHDILRLRGDLRVGEFDEAHAAILEAERRAIRVRIAGEERLIAAEDAGRYRDALGVMPPSGLPDVFLEAAPTRCASSCGGTRAGAGRSRRREVKRWFGVDVEEDLRELEREDKLVRGELRPGGKRARVVRPRRPPPSAARVARGAAARGRAGRAGRARRFLPHWHGIDRRATLREALIPLQALALPVSLWESEVLPRRVPGYRPEQLDQLCASGELVWVGAGLDRVAVFFREDAPVLGRPAAAPAPEGEAHDAIRAALAGGARFWADSLEGRASDADVLPALWDLVWAGEVTNDAWPPLRAERRYQPVRPERRARRFSRSRARDRPRRRDAGRSPRVCSPGGPTAARSPSSCSSVRGSSRATACAARASRAATAPSTRSCARSRRSARAAAATSSKGSAARSSRSAARSSGCASCGRATATSPSRSCSPRRTRRSRTARRSRGRSVPARAQRASPARRSSCSAARRCSSSSGAGARSSRSASRRRSGSASRSRRSWPT